MAKLCHWSVRVNSLWLWWYCGLVVAVEAFLMYRAVNKCKEYNELPWPSDRKPVSELYAYIAFIVISIMCMPFFVLTAVCKVGNYAGDGVRLGRDDVVRSRGSVGSTPSGSTLDVGATGASVGDSSNPGAPDSLVRKTHRSDSEVMSYWRHCGPLSNSFHVLAAFSLLLPNILLDARKIEHGFLDPGVIWQTELGAFEERRSEIGRGSVGPVIISPLNVTAAPPSAPSSSQAVSPEFVNYVLALIIYSVRYPAVFWYSKMIFSLIFSFMLLLATAHYVVSYCIAALFYKLTVNLDSVTPNLQMVLSPSVGIVLFLLADTVMFLSAISIFNYGYLHYNEAHKKFLRSHQKSGRLSPPPTGCQGYFPHTIATASLVLFVALRGAMVYDSVTVYRNLSHNVALASIVFDVSYMLIWISLWFCFTIKQEWSFKILAFRFPTGLSLSEIYTIQNDHTLSTNSLNGPLPNGHVTTGAADGENEEDPIPKKKKKARPILADISNPQFPGFETGLGSPTSALRKSGERKQNRVTFEDSRDETDGADALLRAAPERSSCQDAAGSDQGSAAQPAGSSGGRSGTPHGTPVNAKRKFKRELAARIHGTDGDAENGDSSQPPVSSDVPGVSTEPMDDEPRRKVNRNIFGDFELSETPENTLKRNYRNSLRSKCGQYYRDSREFSSPPAAQSSPVLPPRRVSRERTSRTESPNRASQGSGWPKAEPPEKSHPRNYSPGRPLHKRERLPSPDRKAAFSYTNPVVTTETSSFDDLSRSSSNLPPNSSFSSGLHSQNSESFPQLPARVGKVSHPNLSVQSSSPRISVELPPHLQPRATRNSDITNSKRLQPRRRVPPFPANTTAPPNREIQVVKSKPDMGRRDSALPSSNETSSNDSQDVLCSQV